MASKTSLKDQVYNAIIESIISGDYPPYSILNEKTLIERFGVSKSPVRDALVELCSENILRSIPRVGYEVVCLNEKDMCEIMDFRYYLESSCLHKIITTISSDQIGELEKFVAESEAWAATQRKIIEHWKNNIKFHLMLASFAGNRYIYDTLRRSMNTQLRGYAQFYWDRWHRTQIRLDMQTHRLIISAVRQREFDAAMHYLKMDLGLLNEPRQIIF